MHVVALLSGGKDSCYTVPKCLAHGHTVVALAHITPPSDEPDSFMFQSVGSVAVPALADALDLPLITRQTHARAKVTKLAYAPHPDDEVEDMVQLLRDVKQAFPQVDAVCAGALWSDYQRLRVESAAARVGMLSLAYLWRRNQRELLDEMIAADVEAILVKVAGVGLKPEHLGKTLKEMQPHLHKLEDMYGSHVCGEGGEYETLVLSMPIFKKKLVLDKVQVVLHEESDIAPVAYLKIEEFHLEPQEASSASDPPAVIPPVPNELRPFEANGKISDLVLTEDPSLETKSIDFASCRDTVQPLTLCTVTGDYAHVVALSNLPGAEGVSGAAGALQQKLIEEGFSLGDILYVWLNLETVKGQSYAEANRAYCSVFDVPECIPPPSRACVAMPNGNHPVSIEAIARRNRRVADSDWRTLHVQSLSEWAPPCIGPYAQVVEDCGITFISGALAMHAPNASIQKGAGVRAQTRGCVFNIRRTLKATRSKFEGLAFFVAYTVSPDFFRAIHQEFYAHVEEEQAILAVVPCIGLPKNALVEIRAVGSYMDVPDSHVFIASQDRCKDLVVSVSGGENVAKVFAVRHGNLIFSQIFISSETASSSEVCDRFLEDLAALEQDHRGSVLSTQVYVLESEADAIIAYILSKLGKNLNMIRSPWLPGGPRILGIVTLGCSELIVG